VTSATPDILLVAINARYSHCAYAARTLLANLGPRQTTARIFETDLDITPVQLASLIVEAHPRIVGFSVYLWNVRLIEATARILRAVAPHLRLAAGGPELTADYANAALFDTVIIGEGETAFRAFCEQQEPTPATTSTVILSPPENPATLELPYPFYTDADLAQRVVYVEASRGCPFACAYCTSAGTGLRLIPLERLLPAFDALWQRGLRRFKFLDRSFNAPAAQACALLDFFLCRVTPDTRLHFELNAGHMHESVATRISAFPKDTLHLEVGIQTLNPQVAALAGRSTDTQRTLENLRFLTRETGATVHADLIFGLPGEDEASFAQGFNTLLTQTAPPEVQVNLLKGLPGTRFARDAVKLGLAFNPEPPYELLHSDVMDFKTLSRLQCFSRCWELIYNRKRFPHTVRSLHAACGNDLYTVYLTLAKRIQAAEGKLFAISLPRLARNLQAHLTEQCGIVETEARRLIAADLNAKPM